MQRDVELSGGPLAGSRWPVRLEADRTLWIGIGADGGEYDGRSRLKAIAIYERSGSEDRPRFDFARLEGPGARIAELGRRITRLRANWAKDPHTIVSSTSTAGRSFAAARTPSAESSGDSIRIAKRVYERWLAAIEDDAVESSSGDGKLRVSMLVPGEAEQLRDLLECNGINAELIRTTVEVRLADGGEVEIAAADNEDVLSILHRMLAAV